MEAVQATGRAVDSGPRARCISGSGMRCAMHRLPSKHCLSVPLTTPLQPKEGEASDLSGHVIICGFGRVGELIAKVGKPFFEGTDGTDDEVLCGNFIAGCHAISAGAYRHARLIPHSPSSPPQPQMLSERLIPFVALDVSASRVQVRCGAQLGVRAGDAVPMVAPGVCCRRASPFSHTAPRSFLLPTIAGGQEGGSAGLLWRRRLPRGAARCGRRQGRLRGEPRGLEV